MRIAEHKDENDKKINIILHIDDVCKNGKLAKQIFLVGYLAPTDPRSVHISGIKNAQNQATAAMAKYWPLTLLPRGQDSTSYMCKLSKGAFTSYYTELNLEARKQHKVNQLKETPNKYKGQTLYD